MKKRILQIILLFLAIIAGFFTYPLLQRLYGNNWDLVRCILSISLLLIGSTLINHKVGRYCSCEYKFYKLMGMEEHEITKQFYNKNGTVYTVFVVAFYIICVQSNIVQALFKTIQFLIILLIITNLTYFTRYSRKVRVTLSVVLYSILCMFSLYVTATAFACFEQGMGILDILWSVRNMTPIAVLYDLLCNKYNCFFLFLTLFYYFCVKGEKKFEEKIIETGTRRRNKNSLGGYITDRMYGKRYTKLRPYIKEVVRTGRKIQNLLSYVFVYVIYALCLLLVKKSITAIMVISYIVILIINVGEDCIYLSDLNTKRFYKLLGQTYERFLSKKIGATLIMNSCICFIYFCKLIAMKHIDTILLLIIIQFVEIIYWNLFYSFIYIHMKHYNNILETVRLIFAFAGALIPGVNMILCVFYYLKGKEKWNHYVDNEQGYQKI